MKWIFSVIPLFILIYYFFHSESIENSEIDRHEEAGIQLQYELEKWVQKSSHMGVSAAVVYKSGATWTGVAGVAGSNQPLNTEHLIWIASITKTMTGAVILKLVEKQILQLSDPVSKWLLPIPHVDPNISIKQLLNHTNGLSNYSRNPDLSAIITTDSSHVFSTDELISFIGPKIFDAGQSTQYTNTAFVLLGIIAEKATKQTMVALYHQYIWEPHKMSAIFLPGYESPSGPVATSWYRESGSYQPFEPMHQMALVTTGNSAFGLFSNALTVAKWGNILFGDTWLKPETRRQMLTFVPAAGNIPGESGAGLGIRKYNFLNREQYGHSGGSPLGSSLMIHDPSTGITVAVLMNQGQGADHFSLAPRLLSIAEKAE